jgi:hypothetical protein
MDGLSTHTKELKVEGAFCCPLPVKTTCSLSEQKRDSTLEAKGSPCQMPTQAHQNHEN